MNVFTILAAILAIGFLVLVHELGHFLVSRAVGIPVSEFSIGFGPKLFSVKPKETRYSLRLLFLGGYVRFYGDETGDEESADPSKHFNRFPVWKRALVSVAGVTANVIVALLLCVLVLTTYGDSVISPTIAEVTVDSPAQQAGLQSGDRILSVNGISIETGDQISSAIAGVGENPVQVIVARGEEEISFTLTPRYDEELERTLIGISMGYEPKRFSLAEAVPIALDYSVFVVKETFLVLKNFVFGQGSADDVMGIVGTIGVVSQGVSQGFDVILRYVILISLNLAIMNLLPIPGLDGCKLLFLGVEAVRRKPIPPEKEAIVTLAGMGFLLILAAILTYKDIVRLITG